MFKKLFLVSMVLMLSAVFCSHLAFAGTASPFPAPFTQPDGTIIVIRLCGDEFLNWTEDYDGNLIVFDSSQGGYCYAGWSGSDCISTGELVGVGFSGIAPKPRAQGHSIPENLLQRARQERAEKMPALSGKEVPLWELNIGDEPDRTDVSYLKRRVLIIHVTWEDRSTIVDRNRVDPIPKMTGEQIYDLVFNPAARSVNDYYKKLIGTADEVILPAAVKTPMDGYQGIIEVKLPGRHPNTGIIELREMILINAITFACANGLIDLSSFDTNGDGVLQTTELAIGFIVDGREASVNSDPIYDGDPRFWGVSSSNVPDASNTNGVRIESYFGQGAFHRATGMPYWDNLTIGIICHELGHAGYKFVDTYDYTYSSNGHGYWSLMAQGGWGRKGFDREGTSPGYPDAYNLTKAGCPFVIPGEIIDGKSYSLDNHLDIYAARPKGEDKQYFLLQQRKFGASADNYDQGAFTGMNSASNQNDGGLLIYHIDHNVSLYRINDKAGHYLAGIEEAHGGIQNLQNTADEKNYGDPGDLWGISKKEFSGTSDPTSGLYSPFTNDNIAPDQNKPSGITIFAITWDSVSETTAFNTELKDPRCYIEEFSIPGSLGSAVIDQIAGTISVQMPPGTDLTNLTPTVKFTGQSVTPAGGIARDFTDPLVYTVTAESGDTRQYLVTVRIRAVSDGLNISDLYLPRAENLGNSLERFIYYGKYNGETDKSRLWQVVGLEDQSLVLMQRHNYEDRRYHSEHTSALFWGQSEIYKYLNNIDSPPEAFTGFFTNGELDSIRKTDVKTIAFDLDSRTCVQVDQQGSSDTLFYLPSLGDNESQLTWSATLADYQDKILLDDMIYGSHNNRYWLRSLMLGIISNYYRLPYLASAPLPYYATMATEHCYVRPLFKLIPSDLVFMAQIGGSGIGAIAADANYLAGTGEGRNFKLTVLGGNDGADVGALSGVPGGTVTADLKEGCTLTGLIANPLGMGNFTINYKIVEERDGIRSIAGYGSSTNLTALNIDTAGLRENESYTVYVWLQKNNEIQSHEATLPQYFTLKTNSAVTGGSLRGKIKSYNPGNQTTVQLIKDGTVVCGTAIPASAGWDWDAPEQEFILVDLLPGTYDLVISKKAHTQFTVSRIIAGYGDLDLTLDSRPEIQLMTLRCGDINGDGNIDSNDLVILLANFDRCADATNSACDLNGDGLINNLDLTILWRAYNYDQGEIIIDYSGPAKTPLADPARKADLDDIILENSPGLVDLIAFGEGQITGYGKNGKFLAPISAPDPGAIKIYTAEDLNNIRNNLSGSYVLMNDIDLASFNGGQWVPIGYHLNYFSGVFDGQGYEIKNLTVTDATHECAGLFGDANGAIIKNVGINGANIYHPPTAYAGGVCGWIEDGSIVNCYNDGSISAYCAGGIFGIGSLNGDAISYCYNTGNISAEWSAGGIFGYGHVSEGSISDCYNTGSVSSSFRYTSNAGGIFGSGGVYEGGISHCYNAGNINAVSETSSYVYAGGIYGYGDIVKGSISNCYNIGNISSNSDSFSYAGGIFAYCGDGKGATSLCYNLGNISVSSTNAAYGNLFIGGICGENTDRCGGISNCYNNGDILAFADYKEWGGIFAGGICGENIVYNKGDAISYCYSSGNISTSGSFIETEHYVGGICGITLAPNPYYKGSTISNCVALLERIFADNTANTIPLQCYLIGHTEATLHTYKDNNLALEGILGNAADDADSRITLTQAKDRTTYEALDWDFENIWAMVPGYDYPQFRSTPAAPFTVQVVNNKQSALKYNGQNTLVSAFQVRANQEDLTLANIQGLVLAYDNSILQLIKWDASAAVAEPAPGGLFTGPVAGAGNSGVLGSSLSLANAISADSKNGYISLSAGDANATFACPLKEFVSLGELRFAFREGKSAADLRDDSIRIMTAAELNALNQSVVVLINTNRETSYIYGAQRDALFLPDFDQLSKPAIIWELDKARVSGKISSYDPTNQTTVELWQEGRPVHTATIAGEDGYGWVEQSFNFPDVASGSYELIITKAGHTKFTVRNLVVGDEGLDLSRDSRPEVQLMRLRCGDINGDGLINDADLTVLWRAGNYNKKTVEAENEWCDLNGDGLINDADLTILWLAYNYNRGAIVIE